MPLYLKEKADLVILEMNAMFPILNLFICPKILPSKQINRQYVRTKYLELLFERLL